MKKYFFIIMATALFALIGCSDRGKNSNPPTIVNGTGTIVLRSNFIEFNGYILDLHDGTQYDVNHLDDQYKQDGLVLEFEGVPRNYILPAGIPQKIDFTKLRIIALPISANSP